MIKLRDAHSKFKDFLKSKSRSNATIIAYGKDIDQLVAFMEEMEKHHVHDVKKEDIESFLGKLRELGFTDKTISRKINSTRTFYRFLKINEVITDDPSLLVEHPDYELAAPRILTPMEYRALRDATRTDPRMHAVVQLLLQTGIRIGELAELRLSDVLQDGLRIRPFEKHPERIVPMNAPARDALEKYLKIRPEVKDDHVFVTKSGKPFLIRNIRTAIERYFRIAEIKGAKVNDLRHTFVAHHLKHGVSVVQLSKIVGHKRLTTTERYLQYVPERAKESTVLTEL